MLIYHILFTVPEDTTNKHTTAHKGNTGLWIQIILVHVYIPGDKASVHMVVMQ